MDASDSAGVQTTNPAELALELYKLLVGQSSEMRHRAIQSVLAALGESQVAVPKAVPNATQMQFPSDAGDFSDIGPKAAKWAQKNGVTRAMIDEVFHIVNGTVEITASSVPGARKRDLTVNGD